MVKNTIIALLCLTAGLLLWRWSAGSGAEWVSSQSGHGLGGESPAVPRSSPATREARADAVFRNNRPRTEKHPAVLPPSRPPEKYLGASGNVSSLLMYDLGLTREQFNKVQSIASKHWSEMTAMAAKNVVHDEAASQAVGDGADVYRLAAMPAEERVRMLTSLEKEIRGVAGDTAAEVVASSMEKSSAFGCMGKCDVEFRFKDLMRVDTDITGKQSNPYASKEDFNVTCLFTDPVTGKTSVSPAGDMEDLGEYFGNIFQR